MAAILSSFVLLVAATILVVHSHPLEEEEDVLGLMGVPAAPVALREKRNTDCYYNVHQADGAVYYKTCTSFCYAYGKYPYCYNGQCLCTATAGQFPTLPTYQPQPQVPTLPPPPKREVPMPPAPFPMPTFGPGMMPTGK